MEHVKGPAASEKKCVLLIVRWPVGGVRTFIRYVYRNFDPSIWHFTIIAPDVAEMKVLVEDLADMDIHYVPVRGIPQDGSSGFGKMLRSVALQLVQRRYDLVHSHGFTSAMCSAIPAFLRRTPHVMTSHETLNDKQFSTFKGKVRRMGMTRFFCFIDKIHSVSHDAQVNLFEYFPSLKRKKEKCVVIHNGIEVARFLEAEPRDLRAELSLGMDVFLIGFMGRFMAPKGFRYLVDAIEILLKEKGLSRKPLVLTFGEGRFERQEKEAIKGRGLEENFIFMPFTPNVAGTIKGLDVVAMPSLAEACPLLPMEVLVCGTPIVGSDCLGLREVLEGTPAKVVPKADAGALAMALQKEMTACSKDQFEDFQESAARKFDVKWTCFEIEKLYGRVGG